MVDIEFLEYEPMVVMTRRRSGGTLPHRHAGGGRLSSQFRGGAFHVKSKASGRRGVPKTLINKQTWKEVDAGRGTPHGGAWADLRHIDRNVLKAYPWFFNRLMDNGVDQ